MDVVTLGETMALFVPRFGGPLQFAGEFQKSIGGAESNVMIALSRLGHKTGWIGRLGEDPFGHYIRNFIRGEGVDTSLVRFDREYPTGIFFKQPHTLSDPEVYYYRKESAASRMVPEDLEEEYISRAKYLHLTGILPALSESCHRTLERALSLAKRHGLKISFDPNIRLKLWSKRKAATVLSEIGAKCDILLPGLEEGRILTGQCEPEKIASVLLDRGAKIVVVKLGNKGAYYTNGAQEGHIPGLSVAQVVDTAGAGDGFAAGFLSGLLRGLPLSGAVALANRVGAHALSVAGDVEGYPSLSRIESDADDNRVSR